jgi:hypothetical protein
MTRGARTAPSSAKGSAARAHRRRRDLNRGSVAGGRNARAGDLERQKLAVVWGSGPTRRRPASGSAYIAFRAPLK